MTHKLNIIYLLTLALLLGSFVTASSQTTEKDGTFLRNFSDNPEDAKGVDLNFLKGKESAFTPKLTFGIGMVLETIYQSVPKADNAPKGASNYNFQPGAFKIGFLHTDMQLTKKLAASITWNLHASRITDAFIKYEFFPELILQVGRFKGAGNRAANETSAYDLDLVDFTYTSENQSADQGGPDLRHYGINVSGRWKWVRYSFFLHNSDSTRDRYWSAMNDGPARGNHGLEFKSWDASLRFFPVKNFEFGGHFGSVNLPGMGYKTAYAHSAFAYYAKPSKFKLKFDYGNHKQIRFAGPIDNTDYTEHAFNKVSKLGWSFLAGVNISKRFEPVVRYEYYDQGNLATSGFGYKRLHLITAGVNFYVFPNSPRMAKITAFYQHRGESGGQYLKNDWFGLSYQIVLYK